MTANKSPQGSWTRRQKFKISYPTSSREQVVLSLLGQSFLFSFFPAVLLFYQCHSYPMSKAPASQKKLSSGEKTQANNSLAAIKVCGLLLSYERHCTKMGSCVSSVLREDIARCVDIQKLLTKV